MKTTTYKKILAMVVVISPIISQYSIGGIIDFDMIAMAFVILLGYIGRIHSNNALRAHITVFLLYIVIETGINLLVGIRYSRTIDIILRCGRYCVYSSFILLKSIDYFDYKTMLRYYRAVVYLAFAYILIQTIVYYTTGITLPNKIGGTTSSISVEGVGRLRSFYSEPAALSYGLLPFTVCSLFGPRYKEKNNMIIDAIVSTAAVVLSTSGLGNICLAAVWLIWIILGLKNRRITHGRLVLLIILLLAFALVARFPIVAYTFSRVNTMGQNGAISARINGYLSLKSLRTMQLVFGTGFGNYMVRNEYNMNTLFAYIYYPTLAEHLFTTGIIGTVLFLNIFVKRFRHSNVYGKMLIIATIILSIGGAPISGAFLPLYFALIFAEDRFDTTVA